MAKKYNEPEQNRRIFNLFRRLNFDSSLKGYRYLKLAILLCLEDENIICNVRNLYEDIGAVSNIEGCNGNSVERCIRHLIERALSAHENEGNELLYEIFGDIVFVEKKITNKRFIAQLVEYMKTQTDSGKEKMT
ncbi:MAG: sporulation initiation factor Spo0A C-terminal domain-containing protein [Ruminococcus sp.]|nr:sporulation initiation factor Spo0A C-terminal domain-containing protein [Ruminococcus sp.]